LVGGCGTEKRADRQTQAHGQGALCRVAFVGGRVRCLAMENTDDNEVGGGEVALEAALDAYGSVEDVEVEEEVVEDTYEDDGFEEESLEESEGGDEGLGVEGVGGPWVSAEHAEAVRLAAMEVEVLQGSPRTLLAGEAEGLVSGRATGNASAMTRSFASSPQSTVGESPPQHGAGPSPGSQPSPLLDPGVATREEQVMRGFDDHWAAVERLLGEEAAGAGPLPDNHGVLVYNDWIYVGGAIGEEGMAALEPAVGNRPFSSHGVKCCVPGPALTPRAIEESFSFLDRIKDNGGCCLVYSRCPSLCGRGAGRALATVLSYLMTREGFSEMRSAFGSLRALQFGRRGGTQPRAAAGSMVHRLDKGLRDADEAGARLSSLRSPRKPRTVSPPSSPARRRRDPAATLALHDALLSDLDANAERRARVQAERKLDEAKQLLRILTREKAKTEWERPQGARGDATGTTYAGEPEKLLAKVREQKELIREKRKEEAAFEARLGVARHTNEKLERENLDLKQRLKDLGAQLSNKPQTRHCCITSPHAHGLKVQIEQLREENTRVSEELKKMRAKVSRERQDKRVVGDSKVDLVDEIDQLKEELAAAKREARDVDHQRRAAAKEMVEARARYDKSSAEFEARGRENAELKAELSRMKVEVESTQRAMNSVRADSARGRQTERRDAKTNEELSSEIESLLERLDNERVTAHRAEEQKTAAVKAMQESIREAERAKKLDGEIRELKSILAGNKIQHELHQRESDKARASASELRRTVQRLKDEAEEAAALHEGVEQRLKEEIHTLRVGSQHRTSSAQDLLKGTKKLKEDVSERERKVRQVEEKGKNEVFKLNNKLQKTTRLYEDSKKLEKDLNATKVLLESNVSKLEATVKSLQEELSTMQKTYATTLAEGEASRKEAQRVQDELKTTLAAEKATLAETAASLQETGELLKVQLAKNWDDRKAHGEERAELLRRIQHLEEDFAEERRLKNALSENLEVATEDNEKKAEHIQKAEKELARQKTARDAVEERLEASEAQLVEVVKQVESLQAQSEEVEKRAASLQDKNFELDLKIKMQAMEEESLKDRATQAEAAAENSKELMEAATGERDKLLVTITELEVRVAELEEKIKSLDEEILGAQEETKQAEAAAEVARAEKAEAEAKEAVAKSTAKELEDGRAALVASEKRANEAAQSATRRAQTAEKKWVTSRARMSKLRDQDKGLGEEMDAKDKQIKELELRHREDRRQMKNILSQMKPVRAAKEVEHEVADERGEEIRALRKQLFESRAQVRSLREQLRHPLEGSRKLEELKEQLVVREDEVKRAKVEIASLRGQLASVSGNTKKRDLEEVHTRLQEEHSRLKMRSSALSTQLKDIKEQTEKRMQKEVDTVVEKAKSLKVDLSKSKEEYRALREELARVKSERGQLLAAKKKSAVWSAADALRVEQAKSEPAKMSASLAEMTVERDGLLATKAKLEGDLLDVKAQAERDYDEIRTAYEAAEDERERLEAEGNALRDQMMQDRMSSVSVEVAKRHLSSEMYRVRGVLTKAEKAAIEGNVRRLTSPRRPIPRRAASAKEEAPRGGSRR